MPITKKSVFRIVVRDDNPIIRDHRVHGVRILPGVTLLDSVYRLGAGVVGNTRFELRNIVFRQAIATAGGFDRRVEFEFVPQGTGLWQVAVRSQRMGAEAPAAPSWDLNATCVVAPVPELQWEPGRGIDPKQFVASAERQWSMDAFYDHT